MFRKRNQLIAHWGGKAIFIVAFVLFGVMPQMAAGADSTAGEFASLGVSSADLPVVLRDRSNREHEAKKNGRTQRSGAPLDADDSDRLAAEYLAAHPEIVAESDVMRRLFINAAKIAQRSSAVLIVGETGAGKENLARAIHDLSPRAAKPFITLNAAAIAPELLESELFGHRKGAFTGAFEAYTGKFKQAHGGTLFLDEIGDLPLELQPKLLRALEQGEIQPVGAAEPEKVDVRIVSATNVNPREAVKSGRLRHDLFYRLRVLDLDLPPLRERGGDAVRIAERWLRVEAPKLWDSDATGGRGGIVLSPEAAKVIESAAWPGNVRQLIGKLTTAAIMARGEQQSSGKRVVIRARHLPLSMFERAIDPQEGLRKQREMAKHGALSDFDFRPMTLEQLERRTIEMVLKKHPVKTRAAKLLGISRATLNRKMKTYGLGIGPKP